MIRKLMCIVAIVWCAGFLAIAQQQRHEVNRDPNPITIETFRFQSLEDRVALLEGSRFDFAAQMAAIKVSVEELTKTQDATRSVLIGMCAPLLALCGEMFIRLFRRDGARAA